MLSEILIVLGQNSNQPQTTDVATIAKHLVNLEKKNSSRKRVVIITQGTDATVVAIQGDDEVKQYPVHVISQEDVVDTTAAGYASLFLFFTTLQSDI